MQGIPSATISRLVTYLRILEQLELHEASETSSKELAERAQVSAFQVRKDLAYFGHFGKRGRGYTVDLLRRELRRVLGLTQKWNVVILGIGRLGEAIANYPGALEYDFGYVGLFDVSDAVVGREVRGLKVRHVSELPEFAASQRVDMGFLTVPPEHAQTAAQQLAEIGVKGILNFAPTVIQPRLERQDGSLVAAPEWRDLIVENVDFLAGMKRLTFYIMKPSSKISKTEETL